MSLKLESLHLQRLKPLPSLTKGRPKPLIKPKVNLQSSEEMFDISDRTESRATGGEQEPRFLRYESLPRPTKRDTRIELNGENNNDPSQQRF